jgi:hypothetical protein
MGVAVATGSASPLDQDNINDACLGCHSNPDLGMTLESGELMPLYIDASVFQTSAHGSAGQACVACHTDLDGYPHPAVTVKTRRDFALQLYPTCRQCHADEYERTLDSAHEQARAAGNLEAAICTDCHNAHQVQPLTDHATGSLLPGARTLIPLTCARCHSAIYEKYRSSVHGSALIGEGNPDVPTCIDCHGVHDIPDPRTAAFRLSSPSLCAKCHTDAAIMSNYELSTDVLSTYVADFHGTTVTLFEKQSPDAETNKPVCFDCHGVHDIKRTDDPEKGLQVRENLLAKCQRCHPDATSDFPDAWLSHYIPSPDKTPLVYTVDLFYKIFIPGTLGGMAVLVALDLSWQIRSRRARVGSKVAAPAPVPEANPAPADLPASGPAEPGPVVSEAKGDEPEARDD